MAGATATDDALDKLKLGVQRKFSDVRAALHMREKLLLRQIDVIATTQQQLKQRAGGGMSGIASTPVSDEDRGEVVKFIADKEEELLAAIRSFGRFQLGNMQLAWQDVYLKQEDYITPSNDHETMYKCLQMGDEAAATLCVDEEQPETIVVDFSKNKSLMEHNRKHVKESIINITLQEAKELIRKAKLKREMPIPPLNLEELDDELESSIAEAVSSLGHEPNIADSTTGANTKSSQTCDADAVAKIKSKKSRCKPKITINNCNGTINLRNISSLTINCASEEAVNAELQTPLHVQRNQESSGKQPASGSEERNQSSNAQTTVVTVETTSTGNSTPTTTASSSNYSSNASSRSQSKKQKNTTKKSQQQQQSNNKQKPTRANNQQATSTTTTTSQQSTSNSSAAYAYPYEVDDDEADEATRENTCDFYNRLLNEIKNSLKQQQQQQKQHKPKYGDEAAKATATATAAEVNSTATATTASPTQASQAPPAGRRLVLKNFENLKIVLEANSDEESARPVQIEQWLAEIISETDLEPMQNTDILEHSKINKCSGEST